MIRGVEGSDTELISSNILRLPSLDEEESKFVPSMPTDSFCESKARAVQAFEKQYLTQVMRMHQGNVTQAARTAGKDRREFGKLLKKHQLKLSTFIIAGEPS